jgi:hypothetical protein
VSDTLATLQAALKPKTGMRRIPFPLESYEHPSLPLSAKRLINLMAEKQPADARTPAALVSTPTLQAWSATGPLGTGPIVAMNDDLAGVIYVASGTHFYRLTFPVTGGVVVDDLGDIGAPDTGTGAWNNFVTIAVGPTAVVVCSPPNSYSSSHVAGAALGQITDPDYPGASSVAYVDGYFVFSSLGNTSQFFISELLDPFSFSALDFAFSDAVPNVVRRVIRHRQQIWTIGEAGFQVWYTAGLSGLETTTGTSFFPFQPFPGGVVPIGTQSPMSVCRADQSVWWLGVDGVVYRANGYAPTRVSTHAIEAIIGANAIGLHAFTHPYRGHWFYCLTTADNRTLVYDVATSVWHEQSTSTDGNGPWRAATAAADNNSIKLYGDRVTGQLYTLDMLPIDAGVVPIRQATFPPIWDETKRAFCARVEIEMEVGDPLSSGPVLLQWSDDGGRTFNAGRTMSAGASGEYRYRVYTTRLGSFRQRVFRVTCHGVVCRRCRHIRGGDLMATAPAPRSIQPPFYDPPLLWNGERHSQVWESYFQSMSDQILALTGAAMPTGATAKRVTALEQALADLARRVAALEGP